MKYKSYRIVDGKPKWVVVNENGNILDKNPNKEELKNAKKELRYAQDTRKGRLIRICCNCRTDKTIIGSLGYEQWHTHNCQKDICTGYLCNSCYNKYDPNSLNNIIKSFRNRRTRNVTDHNSIIGDSCEELTKRWREVKNLNKELDCYNVPIDHSRDTEYGIIDSMGRVYNPFNKCWMLSHLYRYHRKEIDNVICYCIGINEISEYYIERIYIFPIEEILNRKGITIVKNPMDKHGIHPIIPWYEQYRVTDGEILKQVNNIWENILEEIII